MGSSLSAVAAVLAMGMGELLALAAGMLWPLLERKCATSERGSLPRLWFLLYACETRFAVAIASLG
jgi:hypothetical protein